MYDFILSCCGTIKTVDIFEQARIACTQVNWQVPPNQPFSRLIQIVVGRQPQYDSEAAYNSLLAHLQQDQQRKNASFILKNLIILDFIVQERAFLSRMGRYNNSQLLFPIQQSNAHSLSTAIRQLISSYYIYIKQKSKYYEIQSKQLVQAQNRQQYLSKSNSITILNEINICFKIQNLILDINSKYNKNINHKNTNTNINQNVNVNQNGNYQNGSQSYQLVQFIFNLLLKTYIYCHSIVSIGLKVFVSRLFQLNRYDLQYIKKFVNYFNQQYTRNFIGFVAANPNIQSFRNLPVKQMIVNDQKMVAIIQTQLYNINNDPGICPEPQDLNSQILTSMARQIEKQKIQPIKTQDTFTEKSAQINQFQPLKTESQPEQAKKQKDQKIKTQDTLAQKYESVQVNNSETLKTDNQVEKQAVQQTTLAQTKIDNFQPITTSQNQKFEQQKIQGVKGQEQEALAKNLVQVNKFGSLNTQLQPEQVKKQQNQKQKAEDSKFIRRTEHAMPVQQLPQKEEVSVFEKYANFYSDMWTQEIKEGDKNAFNDRDSRSFMNPKEIYSYYGVPLPENEQFENESDENGESDDESNSGQQNEDNLNNQQMEQAV